MVSVERHSVASSGVYVVPEDATILIVDGLAGGGGGASGSTYTTATDQAGGGGGGGGGRTTKYFIAAAVRAQYPDGVPWTVGAGGAGAPVNTSPDSDGAPGQAGGFTFMGDFFVATPGGFYQASMGGGDIGNASGPYTMGVPGAAGLGDTQGGVGGSGGGLVSYALNGMPYDFTGGAGGFPAVGGGAGTVQDHFGYFGPLSIQLGGGGGGGGGGGIQDTGATACGGGNSGFAVTANPSPLFGSGGVVDGAPPAGSGVSVVDTGVVQGGGGGGAASITTHGQDGAHAAEGSGSGGGGGGSSSAGNGGAGGSGGCGHITIIAI